MNHEVRYLHKQSFTLAKAVFSVLFLLTILFLFPQSSLGKNPSSSKYGGRIVFATNSDPKGFNEIIAKETSTTLVTGHIFEGLTKTNAHTTKVEPNLAKRWDVSDDGLIWTFYLRQDVLWNDGEPFTADDVEFTFNDLIFNPDIPSSARDIYTIDGKTFDVKTIDPFTIQIALPAKFAPFLRGMGQAILPKHKLKHIVDDGKFNTTWGIDTDPREIVGTGPYKLVKYDPGQRLKFQRNEHYWRTSKEGDQLPYIDQIVYLIVQNSDIGLLKFLEGTLDSYGVSGTYFPLVKPLEKKNNFIIYDLGADTGSQFIFFNQNSGLNPETEKPHVAPHKLTWFKNLSFRQAVAHSVDKEKIIEITKNKLGYPQYSSIGPGAGFFHNPNVMKYDYDLNKARSILASAGFKDRDNDGIIEDDDGNPVEFNLYTNANAVERIDIASIIRYDLEKIGMKVNFQAKEFNTLVSKLTSTFQWDAIILGLTGGIEPHFGKNVWNSDGQLHMWYPKQEKPATEWEHRIDELFLAGVQELDEDKRKIIYDEFQMIVSEQLPLIYTVLGSRLTAVRNKFGNLDPTNYGGVFHNLEEIYIKEEYR